MDTKPNVRATLAGTVFFILWGLDLITGEFPHEWNIPIWVYGIFFISTLFVLPIGMCIGWIQGFPRWSYPYVGHVIVFSLYMMNVATPGLKLFGYEMFGRELWGWRAWIPFLIIAVIALTVTRSFRPATCFFTNIRDDWTLLTFGMFGFMPLVIAIMFDEMDRLFSLYFMVVLPIIMAGTAFAYLSSENHRMRVVALLIGISLSLVIASIAPNIYWNGVMDVNVIPALVPGLIVFLFMFAPSLMGVRRNQDRSV
jgi:hypothetical protein